MISSNDLRPGVTVEVDNDLWTVVEFLHVKPGKGAAFVRTKLKNVRTGNVNERTFRAGEKLAKANLDRREMQFLFDSGEGYTFMDNESFEQVDISKAKLGDATKWIKEGTNVNVLFYGSEIIGVDVPNFIVLQIVETDPGVRGDTAQGGSKPAKLETGAVVSVPLFLEEGDSIRVDTRTGEYLERA